MSSAGGTRVPWRVVEHGFDAFDLSYTRPSRVGRGKDRRREGETVYPGGGEPRRRDAGMLEKEGRVVVGVKKKLHKAFRGSGEVTQEADKASPHTPRKP